MSKNFFKSLLLRSAGLQREIESEYARPKPDQLRLLKLKKLRLLIADRLYALARQAGQPRLFNNLSRAKH